jgi:hypothetical protein
MCGTSLSGSRRTGRRRADEPSPATHLGWTMAAARYDERYGPAEDRYLAEIDPASLADIVVDTT